MKLQDIKDIYHHPLNNKQKLKSVLRYFRLGVYMRMHKNKMFIHPYINNTKILVGNSSSSSKLQYFNGLNDFEEMGLILHFLSNDDVFVDVGANVGIYSILASGVRKAKSIAIEPSEETGTLLKKNIAINNLEDSVIIKKCVVGDQSGTISFTRGLDAINRVTREEDKFIDKETLKEDTLDNILENKTPGLIKIDVEGYELNVIKGALNTLKKPDLKILIMETNGLSSKYNLNEKEIFSILHKHDFLPFSYSPLKREFKPITDSRYKNTIFIRDLDFVKSKVQRSDKIDVNKIYF